MSSMDDRSAVELTRRELSLIIRGLRAIEQQTREQPAENTEVALLRRRMTEQFNR